MVRRRHSDHTMILPIKLEPSEQAEERDSPASIREPAGEAHAHARTHALASSHGETIGSAFRRN